MVGAAMSGKESGRASGVWGGSRAASGGVRRCARLSRVRMRGVTFFPHSSAHRIDGHAGAATLYSTDSLGTEDAHHDALGAGFPPGTR
jgi:hypothetical protein